MPSLYFYLGYGEINSAQCIRASGEINEGIHTGLLVFSHAALDGS